MGILLHPRSHHFIALDLHENVFLDGCWQRDANIIRFDRKGFMRPFNKHQDLYLFRMKFKEGFQGEEKRFAAVSNIIYDNNDLVIEICILT